MQTLDDAELLQRYVAEGSDQTFEELASRHVNLVYSAALRPVRNPHTAEEVTQAGFVISSRNVRTQPHSTRAARFR
jgi:DNA-directed RNA polymerase specialized sigma24 family protein